jgi:hypothetical protein
LVSLKAGSGDIDPYDSLDEVWIQISGIPPKWSNWKTFRQISSSLGKLLEVDWNSLFTSFFGMVSVKIACKDVSKIPSKRFFEMKENIYVIQFKVEVAGGLKGSEGGDDGGGHDPGDVDDNGMEELEEDFNQDKKALLLQPKKVVRPLSSHLAAHLLLHGPNMCQIG